MEYRILGKTGLKISTLGFGGIPIQRIDAAGTRILMEKMVEAGINYIDTARGYTVSESFLGEALEGIRDKFVLATKSMARTKEAMAADIETSLKNLRTDYIDLYQVHNPNLAQLEQVCGEGGALEALMEARATGKIGHIGVTSHSLDTLNHHGTYITFRQFCFPSREVIHRQISNMSVGIDWGNDFRVMGSFHRQRCTSMECFFLYQDAGTSVIE